jgi:hypothetical protein
MVGQPSVRIGGHDGPAAVIFNRFLAPIADAFAHDRCRPLLVWTEPEVSQCRRAAPIRFIHSPSM